MNCRIAAIELTSQSQIAPLLYKNATDFEKKTKQQCLVSSFLLKLMLCWTVHMCRRGRKPGDCEQTNGLPTLTLQMYQRGIIAFHDTKG